jgi:hypothetical protein
MTELVSMPPIPAIIALSGPMMPATLISMSFRGAGFFPPPEIHSANM